MAFSKSCKPFFVLLLSVSLLVGLSSCSSLTYMSHITAGQIDLLWKRKKIDDLLQEDSLDPNLRERLLLSQKVRRFAEETLALPVGKAYTSYSDLERPYAVWNVYAAPALSLESHTWCYPLLGCMAYRGYYDKSLADKEAKKLKDKGYDVRVGGVRAYSTIGYFNDPVLNSFVYTDEVYFVELLIHEIAHRKLYIKDDTSFNENFATAVGVLGAEIWYENLQDVQKFSDYQLKKSDYQNVVEFLLKFKNELEVLYLNEKLINNDKLLKKEEILTRMKSDYQQFKIDKGIDSRYDHWVGSMNNATLSTLANYQEFVPLFIELFQQVERDWQKFYQEVERISRLPKAERYRALKQFPASVDSVI